jgi:hypothetical protein
MVSDREKCGLSLGRLIIVGDHHLRRGDVVVGAQIV